MATRDQVPFFLSLLFCAQSDKGAGEQLGKSLELPSRERLLAVPSQSHSVRGETWLKGGSDKDAGCPGLPQPAGAGTKGEEGKRAGRRKKGGAEKGEEGKDSERPHYLNCQPPLSIQISPYRPLSSAGLRNL